MNNRPRGLKKSQGIKGDLNSQTDKSCSAYLPEDDIPDLKQLFDQATQALDSQDLNTAKMLLNGVINECDRILRINDSENSNIPRISELYYIYGSALYRQCLLLIDEEDYSSEKDVCYQLELSQERLIQARETCKDEESSQMLNHQLFLYQIELTLAKAYIEQFNYIENKAEIFIKIQAQIGNIFEYISKRTNDKCIDLVEALEDLVSLYMDFLRNYHNIEWLDQYDKATRLVTKHFESLEKTEQFYTENKAIEALIKYGKSMGYGYMGLYFMYKACDIYDSNCEIQEGEHQETLSEILQNQINDYKISIESINHWLNKSVAILDEIDVEYALAQKGTSLGDYSHLIDMIYTLKIECLLNKQLLIEDQEGVLYKEITTEITKNLKDAKVFLKGSISKTLECMIDSYE